MANVILIKRGQATNINSANLQEGELALGFSQDKSTVVLYVGNGTSTPIQVNAGAITGALNEAKSYADGKIADLIDGAPTAYDTLKEISDYISTHTDEYEALEALASGKISSPATAGTTGQVLKIGNDGKPYWADDTDTTYGEATQSTAGLMSSSDKAKLDGVATGAEENVQADWNETDTSSDAYIANKPTLGAAAAKAVVTTVDSSDSLPTSGAVNTALSSKMNANSTIDGGTF